MTEPQQHWTPTPALVRAVLVAAVLAGVAVLGRRVDVAVLATPFVIGTVLALLRRPLDAPTVRLTGSASSLLEGQALRLWVDISAADETTDIDVVAVTIASTAFTVPMFNTVKHVGSLRPGEPCRVEIVVRTVRWGRRSIGPAVVRVVAAHGLLRLGALRSGLVTTATLPLREGFEAIDAVPRAEGLVGGHRSLRGGDGSDIAGVRPFQIGDRLHRINWPVSLRTDRLHVTSTYSDRDTEVVIVLDTQHDIGIPGGIDGTSTSLDIAVRAAASISEHYLRNGDRVSLIDLGQHFRRVPAGAGRAHLVRLLDVLLDVTARERGGAAVSTALARVPHGALVLLLSPLVGETATGRAIAIAHAGRPVLVVDTLPADANPPERSPWTPLAWRLWLVERAIDKGRLTEFGVPVVRWQGSGSLDQVLRDVSRAASAPRARR
ncbi:MAG: DUF58 domain-containing protein [Mycobacteriales bacterium]|nr:MAG: DUF58 domain-containing protein [Pseudonocardiales bacterium]